MIFRRVIVSQQQTNQIKRVVTAGWAMFSELVCCTDLLRRSYPLL